MRTTTEANSTTVLADSRKRSKTTPRPSSWTRNMRLPTTAVASFYASSESTSSPSRTTTSL